VKVNFPAKSSATEYFAFKVAFAATSAATSVAVSTGVPPVTGKSIPSIVFFFFFFVKKKI